MQIQEQLILLESLIELVGFERPCELTLRKRAVHHIREDVISELIEELFPIHQYSVPLEAYRGLLRQAAHNPHPGPRQSVGGSALASAHPPTADK